MPLRSTANGRHSVDVPSYTRMFGDRFAAFNDRIESSLDSLEDEYGEFQDPEAYLSYLMYEAGPRYFGGQAAIANSFSTFRTPFWDPDIIELGYRLQDATLGFSATGPSKDDYRETLIQTAIVAANDVVGRLALQGPAYQRLCQRQQSSLPGVQGDAKMRSVHRTPVIRLQRRLASLVPDRDERGTGPTARRRQPHA